jgi:glycosyltransferase involved in cell wall biosynthesis
MSTNSFTASARQPLRPISHPSWALITPVRDEEKFIGEMIESIAAQTVPPARWIIVDDGSRDRTPEIVAEYAQRIPYIELLRRPPRESRAPGGEAAVPEAMRRLNLPEYDFVARFDADLTFPRDYIARILDEFARNAHLGIAGGELDILQRGRLIPEKSPAYHVRGALKMYRRQCLQEIGGLHSQIGWDTLDEVLAWSRGWTTQSFPAMRVLHRRPTGTGIAAGRVYSERGRAEYLTWSHPLFIAVKTMKIGCAELSILKPAAFLRGFVSCYLRREARIQDRAFVRARRSHQMRQILGVLVSRSIHTGPAKQPSPARP